jgi:hypothetical protein
MNLPEYLHKHPLTRDQYPRNDVQKIRTHAFQKALEKPMTRSDRQNRYYWGVVLKIIGQELGYLPDEVHQLMAKNFLSYENKGDMFVKSTTKLKVAEMEDYLETVRRFASMELSIYIPLPNETEFQYDTNA